MEQIAQEWERAWLISVEENTDPHGLPYARNISLSTVAKQDVVKAWLDERYVRNEEQGFAGLWLTHYDLCSIVSVERSSS